MHEAAPLYFCAQEINDKIIYHPNFYGQPTALPLSQGLYA
jgi:hypothetical protein